MGLEVILVGALASEAQAKLISLSSPRGTEDADLAVRISGWDSFRHLRERLLAADFTADPGVEHRLRFRKALIDLIPFGLEITTSQGTIVWPDSELEMVATGFEEACDLAQEVHLAEGVKVPCITVPGLALLKISSFLDRRYLPKGESDAEDLHYWLEHYASGTEDDRRFEILALGLKDLDYDSAGAALLGSEVSKISFGDAHECVDRFLKEMSTEFSHFVNLTARSMDDETGERRRRRAVRLVSAFRSGYAATRQIGTLGWHTAKLATDPANVEIFYDFAVPPPNGRFPFQLSLEGASADALRQVASWARTQAPSSREHRMGLTLISGEWNLTYLGRTIEGLCTENPARSVTARFSLPSFRDPREQYWMDENIPSTLNPAIGYLDSVAWRAVHRDLETRFPKK